MTYQPNLNETLTSIGEISFRMKHLKMFCDIERMTFDDAHIHGCYEIYVNFSGELSFLHGHDIYPISPGDVIFSRPGDIHYGIYHASAVHDHYCIWFAGGQELKKYIESLQIPAYIRTADSGRFRSLLTLLETSKSPYLRSAYLTELLEFLSTERQPDAAAQWKPAATKLSDILTYIDGSYLEDLKCSEIAERFYISESTLNRMFREHIGMSVYKFIEAKRLSYAEKLLREGYSVTDTCFGSGFSDCSRFIRKFKEKFGMTPHKYKGFLS